jgi:hypothetical protein
MTKKLEELLNLPESKKIIKDEEKKQAKAELAKSQPLLRDISEFDKISSALPQVKIPPAPNCLKVQCEMCRSA